VEFLKNFGISGKYGTVANLDLEPEGVNEERKYTVPTRPELQGKSNITVRQIFRAESYSTAVGKSSTLIVERNEYRRSDVGL
jgi:hypothetical protein